MKYLPAFCDDCSRAFLAAVELPTVSAGHPPCPRCGAASRLIPGAYYSERSRTFEELEQQLHRARLSAPQAQHLQGLIEQALRTGELSRARLLEQLSQFPGLLSIECALPDGPELERAAAMLVTLLTPFATVSGLGSGLRPAVTPDPLRGLVKKFTSTG